MFYFTIKIVTYIIYVWEDIINYDGNHNIKGEKILNIVKMLTHYIINIY